MEKLTLTNHVHPLHTAGGSEPQIVLAGAWLEDYGFRMGSRLTMEIRHGEITIKLRGA